MEHALAAPARGEAVRHRPGPRSAPARRAVDPLAAQAPLPGIALQRCACGGGCPACRAKAAGLAALPIHPADDVYEREADRVADAVMRGGSAPSRTTAPALPSISRLQRCSCGGGGGTCPECAAKKDEEDLQRSPSGAGSAGTAPPIVHDVLRAPGQPLDAGSRAFFEPRFGRGFGDVRVHTDARAAESARAVDAVAYTVGSSLVFGAGAYRPESAEGRRLIAHELTHVVQQTGGSAGAQPAVQRAVKRENVSCRDTGIKNPDHTGDQAVQAITDADTGAIALAKGAEDALDTNLTAVKGGGTADAATEALLVSQLGLSFANAAQHKLIEQQRDRFKKVRETLESGYLKYLCRGGAGVNLVGCLAGNCTGNHAFSCPGNRLIVLCQLFWDSGATERAGTLLHEPFHVWFSMLTHTPTTPRRADATCFEAFARRVKGDGTTLDCTGHTNG